MSGMQQGIRKYEKYLKQAAVVLVAVNIVCFLIAELFGTTLDAAVLIRLGALYTPYIAEKGQYWRLFTAMFLHAGMQHLLNNMLSLYVLGSMLERQTGTVRFLIIYFLSGLAGNVCEYARSLRTGPVTAVGASGAVFGLMGALLFVIIRNKGRIPGMDIRRMLLFVGLSVYFGFASAGIANTAHLAGLAAGFVLGAVLYRKK